jgi:hypothetical protein
MDMTLYITTGPDGASRGRANQNQMIGPDGDYARIIDAHYAQAEKADEARAGAPFAILGLDADQSRLEAQSARSHRTRRADFADGNTFSEDNAIVRAAMTVVRANHGVDGLNKVYKPLADPAGLDWDH